MLISWLLITLLQLHVYVLNNTSAHATARSLCLQYTTDQCSNSSNKAAKKLKMGEKWKPIKTTHQHCGKFNKPMKMGKWEYSSWHTITAYSEVTTEDKQQKRQWNNGKWWRTTVESALDQNINTDSNTSKHTRQHMHMQGSSVIHQWAAGTARLINWLIKVLCPTWQNKSFRRRSTVLPSQSLGLVQKNLI